MNILMTSETFLPRMGGAEIHVANLARLLRERGHGVTLVTNEPRASSECEDMHGTVCISIPWHRSRILYLVRVLWKHAARADVLHAHYSYRMAALVGIIGKIRRVPVIVTLHGLGTLDEAGARFPYTYVHALYRLLSLRLATRIISTSEDLARVAARYCDYRKITIIPNGYDDHRFYPNHLVNASMRSIYEGRLIVLTVRRLVPKNGIHYLIEAMPYLIAKHPNVLCLCIGEGRMRSYLESRMSELGITDSVVLLGEVDNALVPTYIALANVVVFPSTAESVSIACAEAMGSGVPIVASRVGGLIELLGAHEERGRLVTLVDWTESNYDAPLTLPHDRYRMLANAVSDALENPNDQRVAAALRYAKQELAWRGIVRKIESMYTSVAHTTS